MRKNPALTYRGALRLLGKTESRLLNALDTLLGGLILASPASPLATLFQLVDQKNEALSLIRKLVDGAAKRIHQTKGFERYELITAAHTVIVIAAFFDAYREAIGRSAYARLDLSEREKLAMAAESPLMDATEAIAALVSNELPLAAAGDGLYESRVLYAYYQGLIRSVEQFVKGLDTGKSSRAALFDDARTPTLDEVVAAAVTKYHSYFLDLAKDVPEFFIWATVTAQREIQGRAPGPERRARRGEELAGATRSGPRRAFEEVRQRTGQVPVDRGQGQPVGARRDRGAERGTR